MQFDIIKWFLHMAETITVKDLKGVDIVCRIAQEMHEECGNIVVTIKKGEESITSAQLRTFYMWLGDIRKMHDSYTVHELDYFFKDMFLRHIYFRDDQNGTYQELCYAVKEAKKQTPECADKLHDLMIMNTRKTDGNVKQISEFMDEVQKYAHQTMNVQLRMPEDLKYRLDV